MAKKKPTTKKPKFAPPTERTWQLTYRDPGVAPTQHTAHEMNAYAGAAEFSRQLEDNRYLTTLLIPLDLVLRVELVPDDAAAV